MSARGRSRSASPAAPTLAHDAPVEQLLEALSASLCTARDDLGLVGTTTLERAFGQLAFSPAQRAVVEVALAKSKVQSSEASALTRHFRDLFSDSQERRDLEPWRKPLEQARNRRLQWATLSRADLQKRFLDLAKEKELSQVECILGTYLLYGEADAPLFLASLVCCELPTERILQHNLYVAEICGEAFLTQHGERLLTLTTPLFPPCAEYAALNFRILRETEPPMGSGPSRRHTSSVYRNTHTTFDHSLAEGGGTLPVVQTAEGTHVVDITGIEQAFNALAATTASLSTQVSAVAEAAKKSTSPALDKVLDTLTKTVNSLKNNIGRTRNSVLPARAPPSRQSANRRRPYGGEATAPPADF